MLKKIKSDIHVTELLKGSFIALFFRVLGVLLQYLFYWVLADKFGDEGVGVFSVLRTILMIISVVSKLGFDTAIVKLIASYSSTDRGALIPKVYRKVMVLVITMALILSLLLALTSNMVNTIFFEDKPYVNHILLICAAILPFSIMNINAETFKALKNVTLYSVFQNGSLFTISLLFIIIGFSFFPNDFLIVISIFISILLMVIVSFVFITRELSVSVRGLKEKITTFTFKTESWNKLLRLSVPMLLSNSLFLVLNWTDILMLGAFINEDQVGVYSIALKIAALNAVILVGVNSIAMPKYAELFAQKNMKGLKKFVKQTTLLIFSLSFPIFIFILLFPDFLLGFFGQEFVIGVKSLLILTIGQAFSAFSSSSISLLNMIGKEVSVRNILIFTVIVNIILNLFLIPLYGINGAAISTASSIVLWNILAVMVLYKNFKFTTYPIGFYLFKKND